MARLREVVCKHYICIGQCNKNRGAEHKRYCQTCDKYEPRAKLRLKNKKKFRLEQIRKKECDYR